MATVYLALPVGSSVAAGLIWTVNRCSRKHQVIPRMFGSGFPCLNFNRLWAEALNHSQWGTLEYWGHTYFAMSHGDIKAEDGWIDTLIDELERVDADVMSAVIPIKSEHGLTSTGIMDQPDGRTRRFTLKEIFELPETFSIKDTIKPEAVLAINDGLFVCRWTGPWVKRFPGFSCDDAIVCDDGGIFRGHSFSEDWKWAQWLATENRWHFGDPLRIFATRRVLLWHSGKIDFSNDEPWGTWDTDMEAAPLEGLKLASG